MKNLTKLLGSTLLLSALLSSCSDSNFLPPESLGTQPDRGGDSNIRMALSFNQLLSVDDLQKIFESKQVKVLGGQYYFQGGTGVIKTFDSGTDFADFKLQINNSFMNLSTDIEGNNLSLLRNNAQQFDSKSLENNLLLQGLAKKIIISDQKIEQIQSFSNVEPIFYSLYVEGPSEIVKSEIAKLPISKSYKFDTDFLNIKPSYVNKKYNDFELKYSDNNFGKMSIELEEISSKRYGVELNTLEKDNLSKPILTSQAVTWWPGGSIRYQGTQTADGLYGTGWVNFSYAWGTTRLAGLQTLKGSSGIRLESFEMDFAMLGSKYRTYQSCRMTYSDLPSAYDDCPTTGVSEVGQTRSFGFGSFNNNAFVANRYYSTQLEMLSGGSLNPSPAYGTYLPTNVIAQAIHCRSYDIWSCGLADYTEKISQRVLDQASMNVQYNVASTHSWP